MALKFSRETEFKDFLGSVDKVAFYGIGGMGKNLYFYLLQEKWQGKLAFFVVTKKNRESFWGIPVKEVRSLSEEERGIPMVIATRSNYHEEIKESLSDSGIQDMHILSEELLNKAERIANRTYFYNREERVARYEAWKERKRRIRGLWEQVCSER